MEDLEKYPNNTELYKKKYNQLSDCIHRLGKHLLGNNYIIIDPVDETTACEIITKDIIESYRDVNKTLFKGRKL